MAYVARMTNPFSRIFPLIGLTLGPLAAPATAQDPGELFDRVVETLERRYWDREFRKTELPALAAVGSLTTERRRRR